MKLAFTPQLVLAGSEGQNALDRGTRLYKKGNYQEAVTSFKKATAIDPGLIKAWENLGWGYRKLGQTNKALHTWETILKIQPDNRGIRNAVGGLLVEVDQWRRAIPHLIASLNLDPNQNPIRLRLGKAHQKIGNTDLAIAIFKQSLKIQPESLEALFYLTDSYEKSGERGLIVALIKNFLVSYPGPLNDETREWITGKLSAVYARQGDDLYRRSRFKQAEAAYKQALSWKPGTKTIQGNLGWALEKQSKYDEAANTWLKVVDRGYTGFQLFHQIANAFYHSGNLEQAEIWYQNASGMDPSSVNVQFRLFELALNENKIPYALTALHRAIAVHPVDQNRLLSVTNHFIRNNSIDQGLEFFHQQLSMSSNSKTANRVLGRMYAKKGARERDIGNIEKAMWNYEQAILLDDENAAAYRDLGWLHWHAEKKGKSEKVWKQYQKKYPHKIEPYNLLARLYLNQKEYGKSLIALKNSLKIHPDQPEQKLLQAKALYWNKQYLEALERMSRIVLEYPDHLPIQYFFGEILTQQQDFKRGQVQWRKVLDMESTSPRTHYYWIKSLYESGKYEVAVDKAQKFLDQHPPHKPMIKLLIDDALFRQDNDRAVFWYETLLKNFSDHPGDWLALAKLLMDLERFSQANDILREAQKKFHGHAGVQLAIGDLKVKEGNYEEALATFRIISEKHPDNRRAYFGTFHALKALGRLEEAIQHLQTNRRAFLKSYEVNLEMGKMMVAKKKLRAAANYYSRVVAPIKRYVPILRYPGLSVHARSHKLWVQRFDQQLKALGDAGYTSLTVAELKSIVEQKLSFPEKPILITFDSTGPDDFLLGDPVLKKYGLKATLFISRAKINDGDPYFIDREKARQYVNSGRWNLQGFLGKYSQFGFVKDRTGYNWIEAGDDKNSLLRRFAVPRDWGGERLIQHLVENHPSHVARVALAKTQYWNGQYSDAGKTFSNIIFQEPRLKDKFRFTLANISYQGGNYLDSKKLLEGIPDQESVLNPKVGALKEAVAWKSRPRVSGAFDFFRDSNNRTNRSESAKIYFPLEIPLELMLEGGILNLKEKGRADIDGGQVSAGFHWRGWKSLQLEGKVRHRSLSQRQGTQNYFGSAQYRKKDRTIRFNGSKRDIDTVRAMENKIQVATYRLGYQTRFSPALLGRAGVSYQDYDDGNTGFDIRASLRYQLPASKNWNIGVDLAFRDSEFEARAYYTPDQLLIGLARVLYKRRLGRDAEVQADFGIGGADDKVNGVRWVTNGGFNFNYFLTQRLKAGLAAKFSVVPGYDSVNLQAVMGYRF